MATPILQTPFELNRQEFDYTKPFETISPPSSPYSLYAVDSSPPSSPINDPFSPESDDDVEVNSQDKELNADATPDASPRNMHRGDVNGKGKLDLELDASPAHPFSASTRAVKRPPSYSKDTTRPKTKRQRNELEKEWQDFAQSQRVGVHERDSYIQGIVPSIVVPSNRNHNKDTEEIVLPSEDAEHALWDETLAQAVDAVAGRIDLSGQGLTYIPPKIADLSKLVVIRDTKAPHRDLAPRRTCSKSTNSVIFGGNIGHRGDEIHLFLGNNQIATLPNELFNLDALVVLSLRANNLTEIPPLICQLRNLRELNVANNKLRYLPSEIMSLKLNALAVDPNPFEENPFAKSEPSRDRWFGPIYRKHTVVPLVELALRVLLAPSSELYGCHDPTAAAFGSGRQETILEHYYDLPLRSDYVISPALREILSPCVPGSIPSTQSPHVPPSSSPEVKRPRTGSGQRHCISVCSSPNHLDIIGGKYQRPVFVEHVEERLSWEKHIAGQTVGGEKGIPVLWRGCSMGCLGYLEQTESNSPAVETGDKDDWSVGMEVDNIELDLNKAGSNGDPASFPPTEAPSRIVFKVFDSADIDLDD